MEKQTSANMQPCRGGAAERHNKREKSLEYIRKDLTPLNSYKEWIPIAARMEKIRVAYETATGQKMQQTAQPIQEIVLVIDRDTTNIQVEKFCELTKKLGMTPLSYAIHMDEGHRDPVTDEWIPNYHAHIVVDTTCWEHRMVERTRKKNGKNVINPKTHKPEKVMVDAYAKTIKFTREDMAKLQDYAAEATGLRRGVSSSRMHEEARQYKAREQAREIQRLEASIEKQKTEIARLKAEMDEVLESKTRQIEAQNGELQKMKAVLHEQEEAMRKTVSDMQEKGSAVVSNFDDQKNKLEQYGAVPDKGLIERRNWLNEASKADMRAADHNKMISFITALSDAISVVAMAATAMAHALVVSLSSTVKEKEKVLAALTRHIKEQSVWKSTKGALLALIDKPATKQVQSLLEEVKDSNGKLESAKIESAGKTQLLERYKETVIQLRAEIFDRDISIKNQNQEIADLKQKVSALRNNSGYLQSVVENSEKKRREHLERFSKIAASLVDYASPELMRRYESRGVNLLVGEKLWNMAKKKKEAKLEAKEEEQCLDISQSYTAVRPRSRHL